MLLYFVPLFKSAGVVWKYTGTPKATAVSLGNRDQNLALNSINLSLVKKNTSCMPHMHREILNRLSFEMQLNIILLASIGQNYIMEGSI